MGYFTESLSISQTPAKDFFIFILQISELLGVDTVIHHSGTPLRIKDLLPQLQKVLPSDNLQLSAPSGIASGEKDLLT